MNPKWKEIERRYDALNLKKGTYKADRNDPYQIPKLLPQQHKHIEKLTPFSRKPQLGYVHFFLHDYQFERVWNQPKKYLNTIKSFKGALTPDFSLYTDYPIAVQIWQTYRNRWIGRYWQMHGIKVIPTITWSTPESYQFCYNGIPQNSTVAISSVGVLQNKNAQKLFLKGYNELIKRLEPDKILFYGTWPEPDELQGNNIFYENYAAKVLRKI